MNRFDLILLVAAMICEILATFGVGGKFNLVAAGLALWIATFIL